MKKQLTRPNHQTNTQIIKRPPRKQNNTTQNEKEKKSPPKSKLVVMHDNIRFCFFLLFFRTKSKKNQENEARDKNEWTAGRNAMSCAKCFFKKKKMSKEASATYADAGHMPILWCSMALAFCGGRQGHSKPGTTFERGSDRGAAATRSKSSTTTLPTAHPIVQVRHNCHISKLFADSCAAVLVRLFFCGISCKRSYIPERDPAPAAAACSLFV